MREIPQLPTTKQFRDIVKTACHTHGVVIFSSRTRSELLSGWEIPYEVRMHYNYANQFRRKTRKLEIHLPHNADQKKIEAVHMKLDTPSHKNSRITAWCLIS
jgi:hypothetical protein